MLDKSVPYAEIWMSRPLDLSLPSYTLDTNYHFEMYRPGAEQDWACIETAVGEFESVGEAMDYFEKTFTPYPEELNKRMFFVVDQNNERVATCTAWEKTRHGKKYPVFHWLAVKPEHQGKGIAKSLTIEVLRCFQKIANYGPVFLSTQTWSYPAVRLYQNLGFTFMTEKFDGSINPDYQKAMDIIKSQTK
ncbi:MAG: GNAT family N-acetyltransferase [Enterococcus sp.]